MLTSADVLAAWKALSRPRRAPVVVAGRLALAEIPEMEGIPSALYGYEVIIDEEHPWRMELVADW